MSVHINGANISDIYHGNDYIESVYKGSDLIFDNSDILKKYVEGRTSFVVPKETTNLRPYCFYGWDTLKTIKFEEPCQITEISDSCFENCTSLINIQLPDSLSGKLSARCFANCQSLQEIVVPNGVTELGDRCFQFCNYLRNVTIPNTVTIIEDNCFDGCWRLKNITIPKSVQSLGFSCFYGCSTLQSIEIPNSVQSIGGQCFIENISLNIVVFEEPCQITELPRSCFRECESLTEITIPSSVKKIDSNCFGDSYAPNTTLTTIYINKSTDSIAGAPWGATNATVIWNDDYSEDERGDSEPQA